MTDAERQAYNRERKQKRKELHKVMKQKKKAAGPDPVLDVKPPPKKRFILFVGSLSNDTTQDDVRFN